MTKRQLVRVYSIRKMTLELYCTLMRNIPPIFGETLLYAASIGEHSQTLNAVITGRRNLTRSG